MKWVGRDIGQRGMHDWDKICEEFGPLVWAAVYRVLNDHAHALDCYQDVMLEAFEKARSREVADWPSLLRWLAVRRAIDRLRQRKRAEAFATVSSTTLDNVVTQNGPLEAVQLNELMDRLCDELRNLPQRQAEAFWSRCVEDMSYAEIAAQLETDANEVGVLIHRAKLRLREALAALNPTSTQE